MIRLIGLCGSRVKEGNMEALLKYSLDHAGQKEGVEAELVNMAELKIGPCIHCNWCLRKQTPEKPCSQEDDMGPIYQKLLEADGVIVASPAHFGRLSGLTADMMDRTRAFVHGNLYKFPLKNKIGGALTTAYFRGAGFETTLHSIDLFFLTQQMIVANSGLVQLGAGAYSSRDGKGRFEKDVRHMVLEDDFGLLSAAMLVDRMVELIRLVQAGSEASKAAGSQ